MPPLLRSLRDRPRDAGPWGEPAFAREVDRDPRRAGADPRSARPGRVLRARGVPVRPTDARSTGRAVASPTRSAGSSSATATPAAMDKSRRRPRLTRPRRRARYPSRMRLSQPLLHDPPRRPGRRRDAVAPPAAAGRLRPPARLRDLLAAAARLPGQQAGRAGHPRGDGPDRLPGDGDAGRPPGRRLAGERPLRRDRPGAGPVQGPQRPRHGPGDDPRGGRRRCCSPTSSSRIASCR